MLIAALVALCVMSYRQGWLRFSYPSRARYPVQGIDVSHHQGPIDWAAVAAHGVGFAFIKSTEGEDHADSRFAENWPAATEAGVPWGPYHFFTFCTPGASQAAHFFATAGAAPRQLPPAVDVEFAGNCRSWSDLGAVRRELADFLERVEGDFGERPLLYVTRRAQRELLGEHFPDHPRWPRSLLREPPTKLFGPWSFWQFADNARLPGIRGPVDLNAYCCETARFPRTKATATPQR